MQTRTSRWLGPLLAGLIGLLALPAHADDKPSDDSGLYVIVEATQRPLDALLVLPVVCATTKKDCELVEATVANDARLSGFVRSLRGTSAQAGQITKTALPNFTVRTGPAVSAGAAYVLALSLKPGKQPGYLELSAALVGAHDGRLYPLQDYALQNAPQTSLRSMAHRVLNGVQGAITGVEGSFDTVIYYSAPGPGCQRCIWQVDADGANRRIIVGDPGIHMFPVQLQDGGLAYTSFRTGMPSLFKLDAFQLMATSDLTPTLPKSVKTKGPVPVKANSETPTPIAAGKDLQFRGCAQHPRGEIVATINDGDQADIYLLDHTGEPVRNLTNNPANDLSPSISPDGEYIAFISDRTGEPQVYVMNFDGSGQRRLTFAGNYNADPDWGPDGKIAYSGQRGNALDVLTVTLQGKMQRLTPGQGRRSLEPTWSPCGKRLIYTSNEDGRGQRLWITSADGAVREPIDVPFAQYYTPSWQRMAGKSAKRWGARQD
jgi:Tol biopolymer transport system component